MNSKGLMKTCETCKFWDKEQQSVIGQGFCKENSPQVLVIGANKFGQPVFAAIFPTTNKDCWCHKHEPDLETVIEV